MTTAFVATFIVLSIIGTLNAGYLVWKHHKKNQQPFVCPMNHDCSVVTESKWSRIFYFRNDTLGFLFYVAVFMGILATLFLPELTTKIYLFLLLGASGGILFSVFLVLLQIFFIKDYCFYCMISALVTFLLFLNSLALYFQF